MKYLSTPTNRTLQRLKSWSLLAVCPIALAATAAADVRCFDDAADFQVTGDFEAPGLSTGDIVTWNSPDGPVPNLMYGLNAFTDITEALATTSPGGTLQIGAGTFDFGSRISIEKDITVKGFGADVTAISGGGTHEIFLVPAGDYDVTLEDMTMTGALGTFVSNQGSAFTTFSTGQTRIHRVKFHGNAGGSFEGVVQVQGDSRMVSCEISGNGSGINGNAALIVEATLPDTTTVEIINCTIAGNNSRGWSYPAAGANKVYFDNCILWGNSVRRRFFQLYESTTYRNCLIERVSPEDYAASNPASEMNLDGSDPDVHPMFINALSIDSAPTTSGDYRIATNSPLVDQGRTVTDGGAEDVAGESRIAGAGVDIGAHEVNDFTVSGGTENFIFATSAGFGTYELDDLADNFTGSPSQYSLIYNSNPELVTASVVGSKLNVELNQAGSAELRILATDGSSTGLHTVLFGVIPPALYVDIDATGAATGTSWADAFPNLQDALRASSFEVADRAGVSHEMWLAEGIYLPDVGAGQTDNDPLSSFAVRSGLQLYGGFAGSETERSQRDTSANVTILSGDLEANDTDPDLNGITESHLQVVGTNAEVVLSALDTVNALPVVLDGLTITAGTGLEDETYAGGLRILEWFGDVTIHDCDFIGNRCTDGGPAIYAYFAGNVTMTQCSFLNNYSDDDYGGAIFFDDVLNIVVADCVFTGNFGYYCSGIYVEEATSLDIARCIITGNESSDGCPVDTSGAPEVDIRDTIIAGNLSRGLSNAVYLTSRYNDLDGNTRLTNCHLVGNLLENNNQHPVVRIGVNMDIEMNNCVIWGNQWSGVDGMTYQLGEAFIYSGTGSASQVQGTLSANSSLVEDFTAAGLNAFDVGGSGNLDATGLDPMFVSPALASSTPNDGGDYRLMSGSPLIGAGSNGLSSSSTDLDGRPRMMGGAIDIGAYESGSSYDVWSARRHGAETDPAIIAFESDPSGSGLANGLAFLNGVSPDAGPSAVAPTLLGGGSGFEAKFRQSTQAEGYNAAIEYSLNLVDWFPVEESIPGFTVTEDPGAFGVDLDNFSVDEVSVEVDATLYPKCFLRQTITD